MNFVRFLTLSLAMILFGALSPGQTGGAAKSSATANSGKTAAASPVGGMVDLNSASKDELKTLPGIGDAYSNAIIKHRPYANKTQLKSRNVIPLATYNKIKDKVIAKQ